jgi:hypothetical protein
MSLNSILYGINWLSTVIDSDFRRWENAKVIPDVTEGMSMNRKMTTMPNFRPIANVTT